MHGLRAEAFFGYLKEREVVRLRKEADRIASENFEDPQGPPWTQDPILQNYKFTNVRRHHDRTSMMLRELFYTPKFYNHCDTLIMNCATYRYFGTWEFAEAIGWHDYRDFPFDYIKATAKKRLENRERVFTGAYVITNGGVSAPKYEVVVDYYLRPFHEAIPKILDVMNETQSWKAVAKEMMKLQGFGGSGFMTKEILLDTTYTAFWERRHETENDGVFSLPGDWWDWTPIGPGARRGAGRVMFEDFTVNTVKVPEEKAREIIDTLYAGQEPFWLYDRLSPTDIQFGLCEFDKYERVRLGQGKPRSRYNGGPRI